MNGICKVLFWVFTIALGFVNPLISFGLIVLYYLPGIIQSTCKSFNDVSETSEESINQNMNDYSDDIKEQMK